MVIESNDAMIFNLWRPLAAKTISVQTCKHKNRKELENGERKDK